MKPIPALIMPPAVHTLCDTRWDFVHGNTAQRCPSVPTSDGIADTILIVPSAVLSWHRVNLPRGLLGRNGLTRNSAKLRAVLDSLLEDQLLDDPSQLHMALQANNGATESVWVAVCQRSWLKDTLDAVALAGHNLRGVVPEFSPSKSADTKFTLWLTGEADAAELVWTDSEGVHRRTVSPGKSGLGKALDGWPVDAAVWAEPSCAALAEQFLHCEATIQQRAQRLQNCADTDWDLAQGDFALRNTLAYRLSDAALNLWKSMAWRPARWALGLFCAIQLIGLNAQAWQARQALSSQRSAIQSVLLTTFPDITAVVDAPVQMQRAVNALGQSTGQAQSRDLERILEAFGTVAPGDCVPEVMEFITGELRLSGFNSGADVMNGLSDRLEALGYRTRLDGNTLVIRREP